MRTEEAVWPPNGRVRGLGAAPGPARGHRRRSVPVDRCDFLVRKKKCLAGGSRLAELSDGASIMGGEELAYDEARGRRAFALLDVEGKGLKVGDIGDALQGAGVDAPAVARCAVVDEFLASRQHSGPLEFAEFLHLYNVVIQSEKRRLRWAARMEHFLSAGSMRRIAQESFERCADGSAGSDLDVPAERFEDIIKTMGVPLEPDQRSDLHAAVCVHGRIPLATFLEALTQTLEDSPMVRDAYTALLRRRQLEERAEIESIFALYDFDASGTVSLADLSAALVASGWQEARLAPLLQQLKSGVETRPDALREEGVGAGGRKENGTKVGVSLDAFLECVTAAQAFKSRFSA